MELTRQSEHQPTCFPYSSTCILRMHMLSKPTSKSHAKHAMALLCRPLREQDAVSSGGPLLTILGFLILPLVWSVPEALITAECATMFPENR
eukprot:804815-Pelagomonas_calceolata.AAC.10